MANFSHNWHRPGQDCEEDEQFFIQLFFPLHNNDVFQGRVKVLYNLAPVLSQKLPNNGQTQCQIDEGT